MEGPELTNFEAGQQAAPKELFNPRAILGLHFGGWR